MSSFLSRSLIGSLLCFTASSFAEDIPLQGAKHYRVGARHIESGGVGYNQGYTTLEAFLALDPVRLPVMPFVDLRGHIFNDGKFAANAGLGIRALADCRVYGANIYYDYRDTKHQHYNQIGLGFETLGVRWDFRANGYLPVGSKKSSPYGGNTTTSAAVFNGFQGNHALVKQTLTLEEKVRYAMTGVNTEAAFHILKKENIDLYAAAGPYYYNYSSKQAIGGQARIGARIYEYLSLEAINSYDSRFHENIQGSIGIHVPFGPRSKISKKKKLEKCSSSNLLAQRLVQDIKRQEIIVVDKKGKTTVSEVISPAVDPSTGDPFFFVFANNTSSSLGTYESPFPTLALVEEHSSPGDIIYVFPGDGTTRGMNSGITLQENQKLWGAGLAHSIATSHGTIEIPAQSSSLPRITNTDIETDGNAITLANNNSIKGFIIASASNNAIYGTDLQNVEVSYCTIQDSSAYVIEAAFPNDALIVLKNNTFSHNENGALLTLTGESSLVCLNNTFEGQTSISSVPLQIISSNNSFSAHLENNVFDSNTTGSIGLTLTDVANANITVLNNTLTNNDTGAVATLGSNIFVFSNGTIEQCSIVLTGNTISGNTSNTLFMYPDGLITTLEVTASENTISGNGGSGIVLATPVDNLTVLVENNTISGINDNGIGVISSEPGSIGNITIKNNTITNIGGTSNGIAISQGFSTLDLTITDNEIDGCEGTGIISYSSTGINSFVLNISDNTISNCQNLSSNASSGLDIEQFINLTGTISNNTLLDNIGTPLTIGSTLTTPTACLTFTGNNSSTNYSFINPDDGTFRIAPCNVADVNVGTINTFGAFNTVQTCSDGSACPP